MLDGYCCQGGAGKGFHDAGFDVLGVDIADQPRYPYDFIQMDVLEALRVLLGGGAIGPSRDGRYYRLEDFAGFHMSPPCQGYSDTYRIMGGDWPKLIDATREACKAAGVPYVIENVPGAKDELDDPVMLCGAMFPGLRVYRHRYFECSFPVDVPGHPPHLAPQVKMGRAPKPGEWVQAVGNFSGVQEARDAMGIGWMSREGLRECIPPAYTEWLGRQLVEHIAGEELADAA